MLQIAEYDGKITLLGDTYKYLDVIKVVEGRKWNPDSKLWTFPRTPDTLKKLETYFPEAVSVDGLEDVRFNMALMDTAMYAKHADGLGKPKVSKTEPWLHQLQAFWFAFYRLRAQGGAMLALDMGCGKSKVAIDLINALECKRVLITCPTSVMDVWPEEFEVHSCWPVEIHVCNRKHTIERRTEEIRKFLDCREITDPDIPRVVVMNHEAVWRKPFAEFALKAGFDMVIVDESHRAKSPSGKLSRYLGRIGDRVPYRLALTGTPCPHSPMDMYGQARFVDKSLHGTNYQVYKSKYAIEMPGHDGTYTKITGFRNMDAWNEKFSYLAVQVKARDALDLPEEIDVTRYCDLSPAEMKMYKQMKSQLVAEIRGGVVTAANALVKILRLQQIVQGTVPDHHGREVIVGMSKRELLYDVLQDINEPVVVFARFNCDYDSVEIVCRDAQRAVYRLGGGHNDLFAWKSACNEGEPAVLAVQLQAGGVGVSMVQSRYCIYLSKDHSLGNYDQSRARQMRPGQKENVTYIHLTARNTIDETINKALAERRDLIELFTREVNE